MLINGRPTRTIWPAADGSGDVEILDQTLLPHVVEVARLTSLDDAVRAIRIMQVRGAPLIGAAAAYGVCLALREDASDAGLDAAIAALAATRPTAVNLAWALDRMDQTVRGLPPSERLAAARARAAEICDDDVETCRRIGDHGLALIRQLAERRGDGPVKILTHCNAGWLATVDWGTALAPIYRAQEAGIDLHVWVDETRPRNQGASLTAFELGQQGVSHAIVADNTGGHLMQHGEVDLCLVGTDRTTREGDVANKIGTYLKALAAADNGVPFAVALPGSTIDWALRDGVRDIPIEQRGPEELTRIAGRNLAGEVVQVDIAAPGSPALNIAFDVTPARLVTHLITERGVCAASEEGLLGLYPERRAAA
ncbi:MAG TPA: S-methyl-5-thioribose-1-phosphate isomerase [Caulobacteraceae bacterium]|jgi:methylthioribose-1-phosphate isomerase|nr:S-methyl-5-thioribose-1-phosphate isomerase [Caulobacteraceae bacterium]